MSSYNCNLHRLLFACICCRWQMVASKAFTFTKKLQILYVAMVCESDIIRSY